MLRDELLEREAFDTLLEAKVLFVRTGLVYLEGKILTKKLASFMWAGQLNRAGRGASTGKHATILEFLSK